MVRKARELTYENNDATVYVVSSMTFHNVLSSVLSLCDNHELM